MKILNDEILNKYIDNELNEFESKELKEAINSNPEAQKKLNAHEMVDIILRKLETEKAPAGINEYVMNRILNISASKESKNYFFISIVSFFFVIFLSVIGFLLSQMEFDNTGSEAGLGIKEKISNRISEYIPQMPAILDSSSLLFIGGSLTIVLLISGYFIIENHRSFKNKLNSFTH